MQAGNLIIANSMNTYKGKKNSKYLLARKANTKENENNINLESWKRFFI